MSDSRRAVALRNGEERSKESGTARRPFVRLSDRSRCRFCRDNVETIDHKDALILEKLCTPQGRLFSRNRSGNCARHQRMVKKAVKRARFIGLLSPAG